MIAGFPTETEDDFQDTVSLMEYVKYNFGYMYKYSERPGTMAEAVRCESVSRSVMLFPPELGHSLNIGRWPDRFLHRVVVVHDFAFFAPAAEIAGGTLVVGFGAQATDHEPCSLRRTCGDDFRDACGRCAGFLRFTDGFV